MSGLTAPVATGPVTAGRAPRVVGSRAHGARRGVLVATVAVALVALGALAAAIGARVGVVPALLIAPALVVPAVLLSRPVLAAALVALAIPAGLLRVPGPVPLQVIELAALTTIVMVAVHRALRTSRPVVFPAPLRWGLALVAVVALSALTADARYPAMLQAAQLLTGVLLAASVAGAMRSLRDVRRLTWVAVAVSAAVCATTLAGGGQLRAAYAGGLVANRAVGIFASPNELGTLAAMTLVLACGLWLSAGGRRERLLAVAAMATIGAGLALSLSRGAWLGGVVGLAGLVVLLPRVRRPLVVGVVLGVAGLLVATVLMPDNIVVRAMSERFVSIFAEDGGNPYDLRPDILRLTPGLAAENPLLGVGPVGFADAFESEFFTSFPDVAVHAHNLLLTVVVEAGVAAGLLLVVFGIHLCVACVRTVAARRRRSDPSGAALAAALGCALGALAGHGLVDFTLRNAVLLLFTWLVVGLLLATARLSTFDQRSLHGGP